MKRQRHLTSLMTAIVGGLSVQLFSCATASASGSGVTDLYHQIRDSVVTVTTAESSADGETFEATGSGVLVSDDGLIITAAHVVLVAEEISVRLRTGETARAEVVASVPGADLALLKLAEVPKQLTPATLADSDKSQLGERVLVVGAPLGVEQTLSIGYLTGRRRATVLLNGLAVGELFQTDADINSGNSGGPMFNEAGQVVGIVSHSLVPGDGIGLNFLITSNTARRFLFDRPTAWTGIEGRVLPPGLARLVNAPYGVLIERVAKNSPADKIGLRAGLEEARIGEDIVVLGGDIIVDVAGIKLKSREHIRRVREIVSGERGREGYTIRVLRGGAEVELRVAPTRE